MSDHEEIRYMCISTRYEIMQWIPLFSSLTCDGVGFVLMMMGADPRELKSLMKRHIQSFIADISPAVSFMRLMCVQHKTLVVVIQI